MGSADCMDCTDATAVTRGYDEVRDGVPEVQAAYAELLGSLEGTDLARLDAEVQAHLAGAGVTFGDGDAFTVCPLPRLLGRDEWRDLERGLSQRMRALNAFVRDAYGARDIVEAGLIPLEVIVGAEHYEPLMHGMEMPPVPIGVGGLDIVRDPAGRFLVLEDNVRTPSGIAYAVAARATVERHLPVGPPHADLTVAYEMLQRTLRAAAPWSDDPCVVIVSDGPRNSAWYEHERIAQRLDIPIVTPADLRARPSGLYMRDGGGTRRVDVVYRRTDEDRLTDGDGRLTEVAATVIEPWQRGQVALVNAFGTGVADDKLSHAYVEAMIGFYLHEEPLLPSVHTYDLCDEAVREALLARIDEIVIKPRAASGGHGILIGAHARPEDRAAAAAAVRTDPASWVAQETVWLSEHLTISDGALEPRHVDLRAFVFAVGADEAVALPGGLTRVAHAPGALVVNSSQKGGGKDTWVLAP